MKKETYNEVGVISVFLNEMLTELKGCQAEKEQILKLIDKIPADALREQMAKNTARFERVVTAIEKLKK